MSKIHHFFSLIGMWGVNLCLFFTRKSNLFFKKQVFKEKLEKNTSKVENNDNFQNFGFQNILSFSSCFKSVSTPGQRPIWMGWLRQFFWLLIHLFSPLKCQSNDTKHFMWKSMFWSKIGFFGYLRPWGPLKIKCVLKSSW